MKVAPHLRRIFTQLPRQKPARLRRLGALWYNSGMEKMTCFLNQALYAAFLDGKTGAQGGEKAHHLLHTGYKKLDVFVGDGPFLLAALRTGLAAQVGLSAAVAQSIVPKTTPSSVAHIRHAAVRGLGTFTWGFLRHSPASVLARGKTVGMPVECP